LVIQFGVRRGLSCGNGKKKETTTREQGEGERKERERERGKRERRDEGREVNFRRSIAKNSK
jgi:hypothetical protein